MVRVRVFICVILVMWGLDYVRANHQWSKIVTSKPIRFDYKKGDKLNIKIIVKNKPPEANKYALYYDTVTEGQVTSIPSDKTINFTIPLIGESFTLGIQLLEEQKICSYKNIMYGTIADGDNSSAEEDEERFEAACLNSKHNPCQITVDYREKGEEVDKATTTLEQSSSTSAIPSPTMHRSTTLPISTDEPTTNTYSLKPATAQTSTESPRYLTTPEPAGNIVDPQKTHQLKDLLQSSDYTKYYIAMVSTAGAILFVSLIYVIVKKCTRKAQDPEETLQLETNASRNMVYAELDIKPGKVPPAPITEDTPYAKIIGVLRPRNECEKK